MGDEPTACTLRLRGLPFDAKAEDIVSFLAGFRLVRLLPVVISRTDGRPTGEAFVEFETNAESDRAFKTKQNAQMGWRYIELYPSSTQEMEKCASEGGVEIV